MKNGTIILLVLVIIAIAGGVYWYGKKKPAMPADPGPAAQA